MEEGEHVKESKDPREDEDPVDQDGVQVQQEGDPLEGPGVHRQHS